jgi:hypothetical protein
VSNLTAAIAAEAMMSETTNGTGKQVLIGDVWCDVTFGPRVCPNNHSWVYVEFTDGCGDARGDIRAAIQVRDKPREPQWRAFKNADEVPPLNQIELRCMQGGDRGLCTKMDARGMWNKAAYLRFDELFRLFEMRINGGEWAPAGIKD